MKYFYSLIISLISTLGFSQTLLYQAETTSRTVQDPQAVIFTPGFEVKSNVSNPFIAKIGPATENPGGGPSDSQAGATNPSGTMESTDNRFHDTQGNIEINGVGQLQFSLPIALPPGIKSVAPQINLVYTSGAGNGIAGYGWNVSGLTAISRVGKNIEKDGILKGLGLSYSDYFNYNGQRLISKAGVYGANGTEYLTEKYSNTKIKSIGSITGQAWQGPEYWEITFEDGSVAWYGATATGNSTARTPIDYNIVKWKDTQGNYITYNYVQSDNVAILSNIEWGGNELINKPHFNKIQFNYTTRNIDEVAYVNGNKFVQSNLLKDIVVYANNKQFKKYQIEYESPLINNDSNKTTGYQFVKNITEFNSEGEIANPALFSTNELTTNTHEQSFGKFENVISSGDYNGDGYIDFIVKQPAQNSNPEGYYLYFDPINNSSPSFVYLGLSSIFQSGHLLTFNIKPSDGYIKPRQGLLLIKANPVDDHTTGNITLTYYSVKDDVSVLNTLNNPLVTEYSKTIQDTSYRFLDSYYPSYSVPANYGISNLSKLVEPKEVDIDSDGISELIFAIKDARCFRSQITLNWSCNDLGYRYAVVDDKDIQNNTVHLINNVMAKNILEKSTVVDFDNNGVQDILHVEPKGTTTSVTYKGKRKVIIGGNIYYEITTRDVTTPVNNLLQYNLTKNSDNYIIQLIRTHTVKGLSEGIQFADFNGDGNIEVILPLALRLDTNAETPSNSTYGHDGWSMYLNKGNGLEESFRGLVAYNPSPVQQSGAVTNYYKSAFVDINGDGKTDIISTRASINYVQNTNTYKTFLQFSILSEFQYVENDINGIKWNKEKVLDAFSKEYDRLQVIPVFGDFKVNNRVNKIAFLTNNVDNENDRKIIYYNNFSWAVDKNISEIKQAKSSYKITYKELDPTISNPIYASVKKEKYPFIEVEKLSQGVAVSSISHEGKKQDFRYRGYITHLQGRGIIGFRQTARSSWYADGFENAKIWSGVEIDPLNEGVPVKEWSIRTNDESKIFPSDISENNTQLLSFKSTIYDTEQLLDGQVVTMVTDISKPKVVTAIVPVVTKTKDFLTNTITENSIEYGEYYFPSQSISKVNSSYAVKTTKFDYYNNPSGVGSEYYMGRLKLKTDIIQAYGDTKSAKEEYVYENNLLKTLKTWNRDNTGYVLETYGYDGFGNITQKIVSNSIDSQTQTTGSQYDSKGRFVEKKTDNLGLETSITYNDWGQILTQTDPLGNTLTNTYDHWGKLLTSKSNLSGTTTYQYEKDNNANIIVTQNDPDGSISKTYTNKLGQDYKISTKAFGQGKYVSKETQYDVLGRKIKESEPYFEGQSASQWNVIAYDDSVFPAKVTATAFNGKKVETSVSGLVTTVKELNGYGRTTSKTTDALGNVISSTDKGGTITFSYNAAGEQIQAKYDTNIVITKYDVWGRKSEFNDPSNGLYKYEYDGFGQPKKITSPKGTKEYTYNNLGQLISQKELSTTDGGQATDKSISFSYDNKGRLTSKYGFSKGQLYSSSVAYDHREESYLLQRAAMENILFRKDLPMMIKQE